MHNLHYIHPNRLCRNINFKMAFPPLVLFSDQQPRTGALTIPNISRQFAAINSRNFFPTTFFKPLILSHPAFHPIFHFQIVGILSKMVLFPIVPCVFFRTSLSAIVPIPTTVGRTKERLEAISSVTFL